MNDTVTNPAVEEKRIRLFEVAEPLFIRFGYKKTTVEDICKAAGISKRTYYAVFRDKGDLFGRMIIHINEQLMARWHESLSEDLNAASKLSSLIDHYVAVMISHPIMGVLQEEIETFAAMSGLGREMMMSPMTIIVQGLIEEGQAAGQFRRIDTTTAVMMIFSILDSMYWLLPLMFGSMDEIDKQAMHEEVKRFILSGLAVKL